MPTLAPLIQRMELFNAPYIEALQNSIDLLGEFQDSTISTVAATGNFATKLLMMISPLSSVANGAGYASKAVHALGLESTMAGRAVIGLAAGVSRLAVATGAAVIAYRAYNFLAANATARSALFRVALIALRSPYVQIAGAALFAGAAIYGSVVAMRAAAAAAMFAVRGLLSIGGAFISIGARALTTGAAVGTLVGVLALGGFTRAASSGMAYADTLGDVAQQVNATTQQLAGLRQAALLNASSGATMDAALMKMQASIGRAATLGGPAADAFTRLGVSAQALAGINAGDQFATIAQQIATLPTQAERAAAAVSIFGKRGMELVPLLSQGAGALNGFATEARELGVALSATDVTQIGAAQDAIDRVGVAFQGIGSQLALGLSPYITAAANLVVDFAKKFDLAGRFSKGAVGVIVGGAHVLGNAWDRANLAVLDVENGLRALGIRGLQAIRPLLYGLEVMDRATGAGLLSGLVAGTDAAIHDLARAGLAAEKARQSIMGRSQWTGDVWAQQLQAIALESRESARGMMQLGQATAMVGESADRLDEIERSMASIQEKFATRFMDAQQVELFKLQMAGASQETLAQAGAMLGQIERAKELKETWDGLYKAGERAFEDTRTPLESHMARITELNRMLQFGAVNADTYMRAMKQSADELVKAQGMQGSQNLAAVRANSQEAFRAARLQREGDPQAKRAEVIQKQTLDVARQQLSQLQRLGQRSPMDWVPSNVGI